MRIVAAALALGLWASTGSALALGVRHPSPAQSRQAGADGKLVVDVWTDRGDGAVYHIGDPIRVHFRTSRDAYVILYNVDTEGRVHLLYPARRDDPHWVQGGRAYALPGEAAPYDLEVSGPAGVEYLQALVSLEPFQQIPEYFDDDYPGDEDAQAGDWHPPGRVAGDPFVGMERINRSLLPYDCDEPDCYGAAYTSFYVERKTPYPRYLCADCHGANASRLYDPYDTRCSVFEIRIDYDWRWRRYDPFYFTPYWYYFRRTDCAPRFYSYKQRWSSSDGWVRFKDSFGDQVLWKKNPGQDPKSGDGNFHRGGGNSGGNAGGSPGGNPGAQLGRRTARVPEGGRGNLRPEPVRAPVERGAEAPEPVRFRSKSRDVAPPGGGNRREPAAEVAPREPPPQSAPPDAPRRMEGRKGEGSGGDKGEAREKERVRPEPAPKPAKDNPPEARKAPQRDEGKPDPPHRESNASGGAWDSGSKHRKGF